MTDNKDAIRRAGELADDGQPDDAMEIVNRVLLEEPDNPGALFVATCVMLSAARHVQAMQLAKRICEVAPRDFRGWELQAQVWGELNQYDRSLALARKALELRRCPKTLALMAYALVNAGQWDEAAKYADETLAAVDGEGGKLAEDVRRDASVHRMYCQLARGQWREGFAAYRLTMRTKFRKEWTYTRPDGSVTQEWQGEHDTIVMVTGEQGLGDEVMAASVVPDAARACKRFILDCDHRLTALFARSFPDADVVGGRRAQQIAGPVAPTHHKSLFGLAELFRREDADFPRKAFLVPNPEHVAMFKARFGGERTVGLAWSGGLPRTGETQRAAGINAFLPLIRRGGARFVSLQYKDDSAEVAAFERQYGLKVERLPWVTRMDAAWGQDVDLFAGMIAALDDVVGVHTSALHLSSALGVPTTILTHKGSGWRYGPAQMLWYPPTTRLFRKQPGESWRECVERFCGQERRMAA